MRFFCFSAWHFSHTASSLNLELIDTLKSCGPNSCYDYTFTIADWDENDATPNPCYQLSACTLIIGHRYNIFGDFRTGNRAFLGRGVLSVLITAETMGEVSQQFKTIFHVPLFVHDAVQRCGCHWEECVGFFTQQAKPW